MSYLQTISEWSDWLSRVALNHLWQTTVFCFIAFIVSLLLRRGPARARYLVWLAASLKFAVPSMLIVLALSSAGLKFNSAKSSTPTLQYIAPVVSPVIIPSSSNDVAELMQHFTTQDQQPLNWFPLIASFIWLLGMAFFLFNWLRRRRNVASAIAAGEIAHSGRERRALTNVTTWLGMKRQIDLIVTPRVSEPGVWRVFRPVVLFPESLLDELDDDELESLMMHELAHVLRRDNLVSNLNMILCCVFWFNPLVWLIDTLLLREREEACDDVVLRWSGAGEIYAASIRKIYRLCLTSRISGLSAAGGSTLKRRLERITNNHNQRFSLVQKLLVIAVVIGSISLSVIAGLRPSEDFVAHSGSVLEQATQTVLQQVVHDDGCKEAKCLPSVSAIAAATELGHVTIHADTNTPAPIVSVPIESVSEQMSASTHTSPTFQSSHATDLKKFAGRYSVDPSVLENFVFDVSVEDGELWLKPSHAKRRRMIAQSNVEYVDAQTPSMRLTFNLDAMGNVESMRLKGFGETLVALRMVLPAPSREGNVVFKLSGFSQARIVAVAGTFNAWNQSQYLFERSGNEWICRINLPPGTYQYKFIVDGNWLVDPTNPLVVHDERGFENSQLVVR
jgi:beta-lactamase regulating signal transducer with metallopeptidase domain